MTLSIRNVPPSNPAVLMGLSPVKRFTIADGDLGTTQTIEKIRKLVHDGMTDQFVNRTAIAIVQQSGVQQFDFLGEVRAIYSWVQQHVRFVRDIFGVETLRTAREILSVRAGDCDDINSILLPSLLMTVGAHVRLVTIGTDPSDPETFTHIYCEVELPNGQWLPLDSARKNPAFGRGPQHFSRMRRWSLTDNSFEDAGRNGFADRQMPTPQRMGLSGYFRSMGMGDDSSDGFDWSGLASAIAAGTTGAANIIRATTPQIVPQGFARNPATGQLVPLTPQGTLMVSSAPGGILTSAAGTFPNWMIYAALALGVALVMRR